MGKIKHKFKLGQKVIVTQRLIRARYPSYFDFNCEVVKVGVEKTDKGELLPAYQVKFKDLPIPHFMKEEWLESRNV